MAVAQAIEDLRASENDHGWVSDLKTARRNEKICVFNITPAQLTVWLGHVGGDHFADLCLDGEHLWHIDQFPKTAVWRCMYNLT